MGLGKYAAGIYIAYIAGRYFSASILAYRKWDISAQRMLFNLFTVENHY